MVGPGEEIQIRSVEVLTGIGELGIPRQRAMAVADYGPIKGHKVSMGAGPGLAQRCGRRSGSGGDGR